MRATTTTTMIIRTLLLGLMCGLAALAALAALATRPVLAGDAPQVLAAEAAAPAHAARAPRTPRAPRAPETLLPTGWPASEAAPTPPASPEAADGGFELPEAPNRIVPRGWFGFGFQCGDCSASFGVTDSAAVWRFGTWPRVYSVDVGGPAARAGLRRGDVITHIDGVSILTPDGGRRFGAILPGQSVRWTLLRDGAHRYMLAQAAERPEQPEPPERRERAAYGELLGELSKLNNMSDLGQLRSELANLNQRIERVTLQNIVRTRAEADVQRVRVMSLPVRRLRYAGVIGGTEVEVRGPGSVIVSESDTPNELVINTGDAVVVIRAHAETLKKKGEKKQ